MKKRKEKKTDYMPKKEALKRADHVTSTRVFGKVEMNFKIESKRPMRCSEESDY